jgi:hypothetical protein
MDEGGPDLDDLVGNKEAEDNENGTGHKFDAWLSVDRKPQHKATICQYYSSPFTVALSQDQLKNVRGFTKYNESSYRLDADFTAADEEQSTLSVKDPALTLVHSNGMVFLAVIWLLDIHIDSASMQRLPLHLLHEPNIRICVQVLSLACMDVSHQPNGPDWEWTGLLKQVLVIQACAILKEIGLTQSIQSYKFVLRG